MYTCREAEKPQGLLLCCLLLLFGCAGGGGHSESHACPEGRAIPVSAGMVWHTAFNFDCFVHQKFSEPSFLTQGKTGKPTMSEICKIQQQGAVRTFIGAWQVKTNIDKLTAANMPGEDAQPPRKLLGPLQQSFFSPGEIAGPRWGNRAYGVCSWFVAYVPASRY